MVLKPIVAGILLLTSSTYSFAASSLIASQYVAHSGLIGAALPQMKEDTFTTQTGFPSVYSESLNYSTGPIIDGFGNSVEPGHASTSVSFDLPRGEFKLYSDSVLPSSGPTVGGMVSNARILFSDFLTVHSPTASSTNPTFITFRLESEGTFSPLNGVDLLGEGYFETELKVRNEIPLSRGLGYIVSTCEFGEDGGCNPTKNVSFQGGAFGTVDADVINGGQDEIMFRIPLYQETSVVNLEMKLNAHSTQAITDFSNTARLFIDIPGGSFTSESGILSPIPEPETYAMMLAGLGLVGFMAGRKKSMYV